MDEADFARVIEQGRALQERFPELGLVAVGGTGAALHCRHRYSLDVDTVSPRLHDRYDAVAQSLQDWEGWTTHRKNPPVLILGERSGVELGLRQQRRSVPLQTTKVEGLVVPTLPEMLRVKAFLLAERRATRDYVDVAALSERLGESRAIAALMYLNQVYQSRSPQSMVTQFAEACENDPVDLPLVNLAHYKGLRAPFTEWPYVAERNRILGRQVLKLELEDALPSELDHRFYEP